MAVILETSLGNLTIDLYTDERPRCSLNFLKLCKIKYYNFCLFHSVQRNAVAQTGDPTGTGRGGESIHGILYGDQARYFDAELKPRIKHRKKGTVSMVNNGANMHGSQFFITTGESLDYLDAAHTVFGEVSEGFDALAKINEAFVDGDNRPFQDIRIYHTVVLLDPYPDPKGLQVPDRSPLPRAEQLDSGRIGAGEELDEMAGRSAGEVEELIAQKEAGANAQVLEMIGDLPEADVRPPDNVLFVCKLNPVTTDDDLEIIFSRFGKIDQCEIIRDRVSGDSLQYAFIEFESAEACEAAYFKMDNVLIDDRRIHVDFSQSVSKNPKYSRNPGGSKLKDTKKPLRPSPAPHAAHRSVRGDRGDRHDSYTPRHLDGSDERRDRRTDRRRTHGERHRDDRQRRHDSRERRHDSRERRHGGDGGSGGRSRRSRSRDRHR